MWSDGEQESQNVNTSTICKKKCDKKLCIFLIKADIITKLSVCTNIPKPLRNLCTQFDVNNLRYCGEIACVKECLHTSKNSDIANIECPSQWKLARHLPLVSQDSWPGFPGERSWWRNRLDSPPLKQLGRLKCGNYRACSTTRIASNLNCTEVTSTITILPLRNCNLMC